MFPTRPRLETRSTWISCTAPCSVTATRASCGVTLIRICSFTRRGSRDRLPERPQQVGRLEERQSHHARVAALDTLDESAGAALDAVRACLVERLSREDVGLDARFV